MHVVAEQVSGASSSLAELCNAALFHTTEGSFVLIQSLEDQSSRGASNSICNRGIYHSSLLLVHHTLALSSIACSTIRNLSQKYISSDNLNEMDTFNFPPLSPASSGAFLFDQQPPFQPLIHPTPVEEDISNVPESHQSLKKKWESLKPLIQRVYIEENKPFSYLASILRDEYDFTPT